MIAVSPILQRFALPGIVGLASTGRTSRLALRAPNDRVRSLCSQTHSEELGKERTSPVYLSLCIDWENVLTVNSDSFL